MSKPEQSISRFGGAAASDSSRRSLDSTATRPHVKSSRDTSSPDWRLECEARFVLAKPLVQRRPYLSLVERKRGAAALRDLEAEIKRLYAEAKAMKLRA